MRWIPLKLSLHFCFLIFFCTYLGAQGVQNILGFDDYLMIVKENHPMSTRAALFNEMAQSNRLLAKGGFDPKIEADYNQKDFKTKNYYTLLNSALKVPTWYGIDLKAGYNRSAGEFLDPMDNLPVRGLWSAGISVPLGKGLVIDQRRAALKRADIFEKSSAIDQQVMMNELLYDAALVYINWQEIESRAAVLDQGVTLAAQRYEAIKQSYVGGDKAAIDTLEAFILLQDRQQALMLVQQEIVSVRLELENYLWLDGEVPLELEAEVSPDPLENDVWNSIVASYTIREPELLSNHPELWRYQLKLQDLEIDRKLAKEELKPDLRLEYNPLLATREDALFDEFDPGNYKIGAALSYPLFLRKERGKLQMTKIKIEQTELDNEMKRRQLDLKLRTYRTNSEQLADLADVMLDNISNYQTLLSAEITKLALGESSLFIVNSREQKYLEARNKYIKTQNKLLKNQMSYLFLTGELYVMEF